MRKVELAPRSGGHTRRVFTAKKEVVLSGGTINTPHILLNSGIGNRTELSALGITTIHDLPDVGKGLAEHHAVINVWNTTGTPYPQ
jgi:choline dehydrogenase